MGTKSSCQRGCFRGFLSMSLIFCILMVKTCLPFLFIYQIILGEFSIRGGMVVTMRLEKMCPHNTIWVGIGWLL
ncbi:hypothetical protein ACB092_03G053400 [Castanea dentata]